MDLSFKAKTNLGVGLGLVVWTFGNMVSHFADQGSVQARLAAVIVILGIAIFLLGTTSYAMGKGRSPVWGALGLLNILGMIVLICLKDRSNERPESTSVGKQFSVIGCCIGGLVIFFMASIWLEGQIAPEGRFTYSNLVVQALDERLPYYVTDEPGWTDAEISILESEEFLAALNTGQWDWVEGVDPRAKKPIPNGYPTEKMMVEILQISAGIDAKDYLEATIKMMDEHGIDGNKLRPR